MAQIFSSDTNKKLARALFHDLAVTAGLISNSQRGQNNPINGYFTRGGAATYAKTICDEIVNRDFNNIDDAINQIAGVRVNLEFGDNEISWKSTGNASTVAKCLVYMAEVLDLYWDDSIRTPYEIDEFKKTILGQMVYKYNRYISAIPGKTRTRANSGSTANKVAGQPKNNFKQSGPQSGNVRDLRDTSGNPGTPGVKVHANTSVSYKIVGDKIGQSIPNVFVKPLNPNGAAGSTNKVFVGSGKGYGECTCFFDDPNDAQDFLDKVIQNNRVPSNVNNLQVYKVKSDPNGYFLVGTEFGICAISAAKLNEELEESAKVDIYGGWDRATEGYSPEELRELHTWMRKD